MLRFIAGCIITVAVQLIGWPRIESAFRAVGNHTQAAYHAAETELRAIEVSQ